MYRSKLHAHAVELKNEIPKEPVVFIKPDTCLVNESDEIIYPAHGSQLHHEAEIVVEISKEAKNVSEEDAIGIHLQTGNWG